MSFLERLRFKINSSLFPERCPYCRRVITADEYACKSCREKLPDYSYTRYAIGGSKCVASLPYIDDYSRAVRTFKFKGAASYARQFSFLVSTSVLVTYGSSAFDCITAVPMHKRNESRRGYNQSELLARECSKLLKIPYAPLLEKIKDNKPQHTLSQKEREKNVRGVYGVPDKSAVKNKRILLIDDIITTGCTLGECVRMLKKNGAQTVSCAVLCTSLM